MKKEIVIEGMMCPHCEARVKSALEKLNGVSDATVSHEKGTAVITLTEKVPDETLKAVIEADGYKVISVNRI